MADQTQTEQDTAKAQSRITRSGEYQKRVDAANEKKASGGAASTRRQEADKPTAGEARKARNDKNRTAATQRDTDKAASRITRSGEYQRRINAAAEASQVGTFGGDQEFVTAHSTAGGGGLPAYPPDDSPVTNDALLVWDDTEEEGNWATEASLEDAEDADVSILAFEDGKLSKLDGYSATEGILCQNGSPVDVKILINFD